MGGPASPGRVPPDRLTVARLALRTQRLLSGSLGHDLYSTPAWDMLLDLYIREDRGPMSLTSLSGASPAPARTSLRMIDRLVRRGLLVRTRDPDDGRRINVELSLAASTVLDQLFDALRAILAPP